MALIFGKDGKGDVHFKHIKDLTLHKMEQICNGLRYLKAES